MGNLRILLLYTCCFYALQPLQAQYTGGSSKGDALQQTTDRYLDGATASPNRLVFEITPPSEILSLMAFSFSLQQQDGFGNIYAQPVSSVGISILTNPSGGTLSGTTLINTENGRANFTDLTINNMGVGYVLRASATGLTPIDFTLNVIQGTYSGGSSKGDVAQQTTDRYLDGATASPDRLVLVTIPPAEILSLTAFSLSLQQQDGFGNIFAQPASSVGISIPTNPSGGTLSGTTPVNTENGRANFTDLTINNMGVGYVLRASATGLTPVDFTLNVIQGTYSGGSSKGDSRSASNENIPLCNHFVGTTSDFAQRSNWSSGQFPINESAQILSSAFNQPVLSSSQTITSGTTINILSGASLTVAPSGALTVNGTLNNSSTLTLQSDATGSASIGNSSGTITGNAVVQRFVPAMASPSSLNSYGRRWRFISSPVQNATLQDLRQEMFVTGSGTGAVVGTINSNGFDATHNNSPTVFRYNETATGSSSNGWVSLNHIDSTLIPGIGYRMFVRGDRSDTSRLSRNNIVPQNAVTLDFRGVPNQGNVNVPLTFTNSSNIGDGWNMVGNPYPSAIDWNLIHDPGRVASGSGYSGNDYAQLYHSVYVYNPVTNVYDTYNAESNAGTGGLTSGIISSGQAFFIKATAANPSLTLRESHKAITTTGLFKNINNTSCYVQLIRDSFNRDEMCIKYLDGSTVNEDRYDTRLFPASVNVSTWGSDSVNLTISCRPTTTVNDTIRLNITVPGSGNYTLRFKNSSNLAIQDHVTLIDNFATTATNLITQTDYTFTVNSSVPQSFGRCRFYIVVSNNNPVPVELLALTATAESTERVRINWQSASEINFSHYEVEKSTDGVEYTALDKLDGRGRGTTTTNYIAWDKNPDALNYYRLKMVDKDATYKYSHTVVVKMSEVYNTSTQAVVFPNPSTGQFTLRTDVPGSYTLTDITGKEIESGRCESAYTFNNIRNGVYMLKLITDTGKVEQAKVVVTR